MFKRISPEYHGIFLMLTCSTLWSLGGIFIKLIPWNAFVIAGFRSLIASLAVLCFMYYYKIQLKITRRALISGVLMAGVFHLFVLANKLTTAANAIVLEFTAPVFLLIYSVLFFHQKFRKADLTAVIFTMSGIAMFFFDQLSPGYLLGNCVAIGAGALMAAMYISIGDSEKESDKICGNLLGHWITALFGIPFIWVTDNTVTVVSIASILILGIVQLGIPYLLFSLASRTCPPLACSLLGAAEPLLNPVWVFLFNGERPGIYALIGGMIVILTVTLWCTWNALQAGKMRRKMMQESIDS